MEQETSNGNKASFTTSVALVTDLEHDPTFFFLSFFFETLQQEPTLLKGVESHECPPAT